MASFSQYLAEAKANVNPVFSPPPTGKNAKFHKDDWTIPFNCSYTSKRTMAKQGTPGQIVGYKKGSQTVQYAVKFLDGSTHLIHSHFLYGPFKNKAAAYKQAGIGDKIDDSLVKRPQAFVEEMQTTPRLEQSIKETFTDEVMGFKWLKTPKTIKGEKIIMTILAIADQPKNCNWSMDVNFLPYDIGGIERDWLMKNIVQERRMVIFRVNNLKTNKLKKLRGSTSPFCATRNDKGAPQFYGVHSYISSWNQSAYILWGPGLSRSKSLKERVFEQKSDLIDIRGSNMSMTLYALLSKPLSDINLMDSMRENYTLMKKGKITKQEFVGFVFDRQGGVIMESIHLNKKNQYFFKNYEFDSITIYFDEVDSQMLPKDIHGSLGVVCAPAGNKTRDLPMPPEFFRALKRFTNVTRLYIGGAFMESFEGIPSNINHVDLSHGSLKTWKGLDNINPVDLRFRFIGVAIDSWSGAPERIHSLQLNECTLPIDMTGCPEIDELWADPEITKKIKKILSIRKLIGGSEGVAKNFGGMLDDMLEVEVEKF